MIESRCGIVCSECEYREPMNCSGCVTMTKPFWGDACPVKSCCEGKEHEHCGECATFPCDLLTQFAYDKEQGDDGKRIEQCRKWAFDILPTAEAGGFWDTNDTSLQNAGLTMSLPIELMPQLEEY